jgi:SAM-dependent methyltransferase
MTEDRNAQRVVELHNHILASRGVMLTPASIILDFGCGSGRHTYEYIDAGYPNTFGYDLRSYVQHRSREERAHFRFDGAGDNASRHPTMTTIPWPDETFDLVFATSVFEHVLDQELAHREVHRVLRPGGVLLSIFPSKWRPLEVHTTVPLGGVLTSQAWLRLWARLGVRGAGQEGMSADDVARWNRNFALHGVNYLSGQEIDDLLRRTFGRFEYVEDAFIRHSPGRSGHLAGPLRFAPLLRRIFRAAHTRVILARKEGGSARTSAEAAAAIAGNAARG